MDHKSSKKEFNQKGKDGLPKPKTKNYSHEEVIKKTKNMHAVAKTKVQKVKMENIRNNYLKELKNRSKYKGTRDRHFGMGKDVGLHQTVSKEDRQKMIAKNEQINRNKTMKEAKEYYNQNYSLKKSFTKAKNTKEKEKQGISKGKG